MFKKILFIAILFFFFQQSLVAETINVFEFTKEEMKSLEVRKVKGRTAYTLGFDENGNYIKKAIVPDKAITTLFALKKDDQLIFSTFQTFVSTLVKTAPEIEPEVPVKAKKVVTKVATKKVATKKKVVKKKVVEPEPEYEEEEEEEEEEYE